MKISNSDSVSANIINTNNGSGQTQNSNSVKPNTGVDKSGLNPSSNKDWSQALLRNISQFNEYEKDNMPVSERVVIDAIQKANKAIMGGNRRFEFSIHEETNEIVVKVFNSDTDELIKEIPNEKILDMVAKICEMAGVFVDERR